MSSVLVSAKVVNSFFNVDKVNDKNFIFHLESSLRAIRSIKMLIKGGAKYYINISNRFNSAVVLPAHYGKPKYLKESLFLLMKDEVGKVDGKKTVVDLSNLSAGEVKFLKVFFKKYDQSSSLSSLVEEAMAFFVVYHNIIDSILELDFENNDDYHYSLFRQDSARGGFLIKESYF